MNKVIENLLLEKDSYFPDANTRNTVQKDLIVKSFQYHYENNDMYREYCERVGITISDVQKDIHKIPLLPSTIFKRTRVRTNSGEETIKYCHSSGTQGNVSTIERDTTTMDRFIKTIANTNKNVFNLKDGPTIVFALCQPPEQAKDLWIAHVLTMYGNFYPINFCVDNNVFKVEKLVDDINSCLKEGKNVITFGPPIMNIRILEYLEKNNIKLDSKERLFMITAGGWKKFSNEAISRADFKSKHKENIIGIVDENIRDLFNMTELNSFIPECEHGSKHVPVWLDVFPVDFNTYEEAAIGEKGLLAFLDATSTSFPDFVVSGDVGRVTYVDNCPCGKKGICVEIIRRINTIEARGCALKVDMSLKS